MSTLFAFLHHLAAFTLVGALAVEFVLIGQELSLATARRLTAADAVLGAAAGILLIVGLLRVFFFEKGAAYYFQATPSSPSSRCSSLSRWCRSCRRANSCRGAVR
jgi:putative membrane protein